MKTRIKMRVTPEQSKQVQEIVFSNGGGWQYKRIKEIKYTQHKVIFIDENKMLSHQFDDIEYFNEHEFKEIDADLFIRTNGACEIDNTDNKKEPKYKIGDILAYKYSSSKYKIISQDKSDEELYKVKNIAGKGEHWVRKEDIDADYFYIKTDEIYPQPLRMPITKETEELNKQIDNLCLKNSFLDKEKIECSKDNATNPNHYNQMKIQPNEYITANYECFSWNTANVIKYTSRYKSKNGIEDLEKAIKYLQFEIEELRKAEQ